MVTETFASPDELAAFCTGSTAVYLLVGTVEQCRGLMDEIARYVDVSEKCVHLCPDAKIFEQMERPSSMPAIGAWSGKGTLVGYREGGESLSEFVEYARRFT